MSEKSIESSVISHVLSEGHSTPISITRRTDVANNDGLSKPEAPTRLVSMLSVGFILVWLGFHAVSSFTETSYVDLVYLFGVNTGNPQYFEYLTAIVVHGGFAHLLVNVLAFLSFGGLLHRHLGSSGKYLSYFFASGVLCSLLQVMAFNYAGISQNVPLVGASGAISSVFAYFALSKSESKVKLFFILNMKAKNAMSVFIIVSVVAIAYGGIGVGGIAHTAHLSGLLIGVCTAIYFGELPNKAPLIDADYLSPFKQVRSVIPTGRLFD